eukprot:7640307-Pyramimonas_sp.AAC.1
MEDVPMSGFIEMNDAKIDALLDMSDEELVSYINDVERALDEEGWSGTWAQYHNGNANCEILPGDSGGFSLFLLANRGCEVRLKDLTPEEKREFASSDLQEWEGIVATKS